MWYHPLLLAVEHRTQWGLVQLHLHWIPSSQVKIPYLCFLLLWCLNPHPSEKITLQNPTDIYYISMFYGFLIWVLWSYISPKCKLFAGLIINYAVQKWGFLFTLFNVYMQYSFCKLIPSSDPLIWLKIHSVTDFYYLFSSFTA